MEEEEEEEEARTVDVTVFQAYGRPLTSVSSFKYTGQMLTASEDFWPEVVKNMSKARWKWDQMSRILGQ